MTLPGDSFMTTRWTRVIAAGGDSPEAQQALRDLCALNYAPVLRFLRVSGLDADQARELTHESFAHVLEIAAWKFASMLHRGPRTSFDLAGRQVVKRVHWQKDPTIPGGRIDWLEHEPESPPRATGRSIATES